MTKISDETRVAEVVGVVKAKDTGAAVYAHVAAKAKDNEPHGLDAHLVGTRDACVTSGDATTSRDRAESSGGCVRIRACVCARASATE